MVTKPSDLWNDMPSVAELLEKPPIRALAERWNRSVVAAGVRSFLDELRNDLERRAADLELPTLRELAERAARHVVALQQHSQRPAINATGRILGSPWISSPLPELALERAFGLGRDFVAGPVPPSSTASPLAADAVSLLCRLTQAQAATAVHSYVGAVWLTLAAIGADQEVLVSRGEMGDLNAGCSLPQLAASTSTILREVGATNRTRAADYESAITPQTAALLQLRPDEYRIVGETEAPELGELVGLARDRELTLIDALGAAPLVDLPPELGVDCRSAQASIAAGADLVIVRGDGLVDGPPCGILLGNRDQIARITEHPLFAVWQLDPLRVAALTATLECLSDASTCGPRLPVLQLLSTPLENLRDRAERLAPQLARADGIASAEPVATRSQLSPADPPERGLPSSGIALTSSDGEVHNLAKRLSRATQPVFGRIEGDRLILDLRTVFPRQDQLLVEAIAGSQSSAPSAAVGR